MISGKRDRKMLIAKLEAESANYSQVEYKVETLALMKQLANYNRVS